MSAGFWAVALLWLPVVERTDVLISVVPWMDRLGHPDPYLHLLVESTVALVILAPMGLPSALLCRELWRSGYRRMAWSAGAAVLAAAVVIIFSDTEIIYSLQGTIGRLALALGILTPVLPVWTVVCPAIIGMLIWVATAALRRRRKESAVTHGRGAPWSVGLWLLALLWLPVLVIGTILADIFPSLGASPSEFELSVFHPPLTVVPMGEVQLWVRFVPMFVIALFVFSPAGLAVALPCRQLWRLGYRRTAWIIGVVAALTNAALLALAMELFLLVSAPSFSGTIGQIVGTLYYLAQTLPADIPVYLAIFNLPLLTVVLLLRRCNRTRNGRSSIDEGHNGRGNGTLKPDSESDSG
ncbi:MAG: hypothetical protein OXS40_14785 [Gammaproteobacteria bacterium]|nr:hypothetical protein [Gammaproteobacteria bacterium]